MYPWKPKRFTWLTDKHKHESPEALEEVLERAEHQASRYSGKQTKTTESHHHPVQHTGKPTAVSVACFMAVIMLISACLLKVKRDRKGEG